MRLDHQIIRDIVEERAKILDLGCGNGDLMYILANEKQAIVQGIEINEEAIYRCVEKGLSVFHSDIDSGLSEYPDSSFDYVILNQSLQQVKRVEFVISEALRVAKRVIIGFPNFAYLNSRSMLFLKGKAPVTGSLPYRWYDSPNLHFLSITDFREYCLKHEINVCQTYYLGDEKKVKFWPNLFAENAIFVLQR